MAIVLRPCEQHIKIEHVVGFYGVMMNVGVVDIQKRDVGQQRHIVVADDNRTNLLLLERILKNGGYHPVSVMSGEAALNEVYKSDHISGVLLDVSMPEMDGIETTRLIRLAEVGIDQRARLPIVILTADNRSETEAACLLAGADAFLSHPVRQTKLLNIFSMLIGEREDVGQSERDTARLTYRGTGDQGINKETIAELRALGGPALLEQLTSTLQTDSESAFGYMRLAIEKSDVVAFKEQVMNIYSQTAALGSTGTRSVYAHTTRMEPRQLSTTGPIVLERLIYEVEMLLEAIKGNREAL